MSLSAQILEAQERKRLAEERAALEEERLATLKRAKLLEERLALLGASGSDGNQEQEDSDIECLGEQATEFNFHGTSTEWHPLQKHLISAVKLKHPGVPSMEQTAAYINAWSISGFSHSSLWDRIASNEHLLSQKKVRKDELQKDLWKRLHAHRGQIDPKISISFLVDRTVEFYREELKRQEPALATNHSRRKQKSREGGDATVSFVDLEAQPVRLEASGCEIESKTNMCSPSLVDLDTPPASVVQPPVPPAETIAGVAGELEEGEYESSEENESLPELQSGQDSPIYRPPSISPTFESTASENLDINLTYDHGTDTATPPRKLDLSQMEEDPRLHLLPGHPLQCPPMAGEFDNYLPLCLEIFTHGTSYVQPQLLHIAARLPGGRRLFIPVVPRDSRSAPSLLKKMGYVLSRDHPSGFVHENSDRVLELFSPRDAITELLNWLKSSLRKSNKTGVLLVVLHRETLLMFLCCLDKEEQARILDILHCWVALDDPIWEQLGSEDEKRRQITFEHVATILHLDNFPPSRSPLENDIRWKCDVLEQALNSLKKRGALTDHCFALTPTCLEKVAIFKRELVKFDELCDHLKGQRMEIDGEEVKAICRLFPRAGHGLESWQELYATTFCHLLVLLRLTMSRLGSMAKSRDQYEYGPEKLITTIQEEVGKIWKVGQTLDRVSNAAVGWVLTRMRREEEGGRPNISVSDSSTCEDSEGSMPDEVHRPSGKQKEDIDQRLLSICANEETTNQESTKGNARELKALRSNAEMKKKRAAAKELTARKRSKREPQERKIVTEADLAREAELAVQALVWVPVEPSVDSCNKSEDEMVEQLREDYKEYRQIRKCPPDQYPLHEFLFYHPVLAKTLNTDSRHFILADLCRQLASLGSLASLLKTLANLRQACGEDELHERAGKELNKDKFPSSGQLRRDKLVTLILEWAKQATNPESFSPSDLGIALPSNKNKGLNGLEGHLFHCYLQQAIRMEKEGDLQGFALNKVNVVALISAVSSLVASIEKTGFSLSGAAQWHIVGRLHNKLKRQLKQLKGNLDAGTVRLLLRQLFDYVDSAVKTGGKLLRLPSSPFHQKLLSEQVVKLLQDGCLVKREEMAGVKVTGGISFHAIETLMPCEDTAAEDGLGEDMKEEGKGLIVLGQVVLLHPVVLPACSAKMLFACVSGLPRIKKEANVKVSQASKSQNCLTPSQVSKVIDDNLVQIKLKNKQETEVRLAKGMMVGKAQVIDQSDRLPSFLCPSYCLHFIKKYFNTHGLTLSGTYEKGDHVFFGADGDLIDPVSLPKNQRTNFKIWGSMWAWGVQNFYTVDAIIYFLHQFPKSEDYPEYLRMALTCQKQIVRHQDVAALLAFMKDSLPTSCEEVDPMFTHDKDEQLSLILAKEESDDDVTEELNPFNSATLLSSAQNFVEASWRGEKQPARKVVDRVVHTLEELGLPIYKLREKYLGVPNHKEHFKQILKDLIAKKMEKCGREHAKELMEMCKQDFKHMPRPGTKATLIAFLQLAQLFGQANEALEDMVKTSDNNIKGELLWTKDREENVKGLLQCLSEKQIEDGEEGDIVVHTAATEKVWSVVVSRGNSLLYMAKTVLGRDIDELTQLEREAKSVVWAIQLMRHILPPNCSISLPLSCPSLVAMFTPGSTSSKYWLPHLEGLQCNVHNRGDIVNPASALTFVTDQKRTNVPLDWTIMVQEVAMHLLDKIKETAKKRSKILKILRKRQLEELSDTSDSGIGRGATHLDRTLAADHMDLAGKTDNSAFPECPQKDFQPLFKPLFSRILANGGCKEEATKKAEKMIHWLAVHGITYADLQELLGRMDDGEDLEQEVGSYFDKVGMGKIRGRPDLISTIVSHFRLIRETSSGDVKLEHFETDTLSKGNGPQFEEIELVQLDSSDEEMTG